MNPADGVERRHARPGRFVQLGACRLGAGRKGPHPAAGPGAFRPSAAAIGGRIARATVAAGARHGVPSSRGWAAGLDCPPGPVGGGGIPAGACRPACAGVGSGRVCGLCRPEFTRPARGAIVGAAHYLTGGAAVETEDAASGGPSSPNRTTTPRASSTPTGSTSTASTTGRSSSASSAGSPGWTTTPQTARPWIAGMRLLWLRHKAARRRPPGPAADLPFRRGFVYPHNLHLTARGSSSACGPRRVEAAPLWEVKISPRTPADLDPIRGTAAGFDSPACVRRYRPGPGRPGDVPGRSRAGKRAGAGPAGGPFAADHVRAFCSTPGL